MSRRTRTGLMPPATAVAASVYEGLRITIPAREALIAAGNDVAQEPSDGGPAKWRVTLRRPPAGIVIARLGAHSDDVGIRLVDEPEWPGEWPDDAIAWHERGAWVGCPCCGAALVWYEAGYVPGYRVCARAPHHHAQLSSDGSSATAVRR